MSKLEANERWGTKVSKHRERNEFLTKGFLCEKVLCLKLAVSYLLRLKKKLRWGKLTVNFVLKTRVLWLALYSGRIILAVVRTIN